MEDNEDPVKFLSLFDEKKATLERLGTCTGYREILLLFLEASPESYNDEITRLEVSTDLDCSMVEHRIGARFRKLGKGGEVGLVARAHEGNSKQSQRARSKGST